jgi:hypothetical protein
MKCTNPKQVLVVLHCYTETYSLHIYKATAHLTTSNSNISPYSAVELCPAAPASNHPIHEHQQLFIQNNNVLAQRNQTSHSRQIQASEGGAPRNKAVGFEVYSACENGGTYGSHDKYGLERKSTSLVRPAWHQNCQSQCCRSNQQFVRDEEGMVEVSWGIGFVLWRWGFWCRGARGLGWCSFFFSLVCLLALYS